MQILIKWEIQRRVTSEKMNIGTVVDVKISNKIIIVLKE